MTTETTKPEDKSSPIEVENPHIDDGGTPADRDISAAPDSASTEQPERPETKIVPIGDGGRAAIADRFKAKREDKEKPVEASGDYTDPAQTYGTVAQQVDEPAPADKTDPQPQEKFKLKVRGEEREVDRAEAMRLAKVVTGNDDTEGLSDDHLARLAQIGAAGQSYLEDTRQVLETTRTQVQVSRQHPDETQPAPTATDPNDQDDGNTPADPVKDIVHEIQYGDPDQAAEKLRTTIADAAVNAVKQANSDSRVQDDIRNDLRAHDEFVKKHTDLASDPIATAVIREGLMAGYRDDLRKIGVPEDKIPTDPSMLANHHRHYKLAGQPVRSVATLLEDSAEKLTKWRGGQSRTEDPNPKPQPQERAVRVDVNRDDRRRAIPQQPTRANVQPQLNNTQPSGQKSRSDAVQAAKRARGQV